MFLTLLGDNDHEIRMFVSASLASIFANYTFENYSRLNTAAIDSWQLPKAKQRKIYSEIEAIMLQSVNFKVSRLNTLYVQVLQMVKSCLIILN